VIGQDGGSTVAGGGMRFLITCLYHVALGAFSAPEADNVPWQQPDVL